MHDGVTVKNVVDQINAGNQTLFAIHGDTHLGTTGVPHNVHHVVVAVFQIAAIDKCRHGTCSEVARRIQMRQGPIVQHGNVIGVNVPVFPLVTRVKLHPKTGVEVRIRNPL